MDVVLALALAACAGAQKPAPRTAPATPAREARATKKPVVAVFDVQAQGVQIGPDVLERLSDYLTVILIESKAFKIVPREQLVQRLRTQKRASYKACYEQECQVEIGRELAASKTLSAQIVRLGSTCSVTATLLDLRSATAESGARQQGPCDEAEIAAMFIPVVARLTGQQPTRFPLADGDANDDEIGLEGRTSRRRRAITLDCADCVFAVDEDPTATATGHRTKQAQRRYKSHYEKYKRQQEARARETERSRSRMLQDRAASRSRARGSSQSD